MDLSAIAKAHETALRQLDLRPIYSWAGEHVENPAAWTISGRFNVEISNHFKGPFDALRDHRYRRVVVRKPVRGGGSIISDVWFPWLVANNPGPALWVMQTDKMATDHAITRLIPILKACKKTAALLPSDIRKIRKSGIIFNHGMTSFYTGPALTNLQSKGVQWGSFDEVWEWPAGRLGQAVARLGDFDLIGNSKALITSQGGYVGTEWEAIDSESSQNEWMVPCQKCGKFQRPVFGAKRPNGSRYGIVWDKTEKTKYPDGRYNFGEIVATMRYECEHCGHGHANQNATQAAWNRSGRYEPQNPHPVPTIAGFHWHGVIFKNWADLAIEFLTAQTAKKKGLTKPLEDFVTKKEANHWDEMMLHSTQRIELADYPREWPDEAYRFMTVDVMGDMMWFVIRAWALDGRSRRIAFGRVHTWDQVVELQLKHNVKSPCVGVDARWETAPVYYQCAKHGWLALMGSDQKSFPHEVRQHGRKVAVLYRCRSKEIPKDPFKGTSKEGQSVCFLYLWSNPSVKPILKNMRDGRGVEWLLGTNQGVNATDEEYNTGMHSEFLIIEADKNGFRKPVWKHVKSKPNHPWDCENMQCVMADIAEIFTVEPAPEPSSAPKTPEPQQTETA